MALHPHPRGASSSLARYRTAAAGHDLVLSVFDAASEAYRVGLRASRPVYCGMIRGTQIVRLADEEASPFSFVPGESLVVPAMQTAYLDFPDATDEPVRFLTLEINRETADGIIDQLRDARSTAADPARRSLDASAAVHFVHSDGLDRVLTSIPRLFEEPFPHPDLIVDLRASELLLRLLDEEPRLLRNPRTADSPHHGLAAAVRYARERLDSTVTVRDLADVACMSTSTFYRYFQSEFGMTPLEFLTKERVEHARDLLADPDATVADVSAAVGFKSTSHFIRVFKSAEGVTPKQYQLQGRS